MGRALEQALARLREFDADQPARRGACARRRAVSWCEGPVMRSGCSWCSGRACGLRNTRSLMRDYSVPGEVQLGMGPVLPALKSWLKVCRPFRPAVAGGLEHDVSGKIMRKQGARAR